MPPPVEKTEKNSKDDAEDRPRVSTLISSSHIEDYDWYLGFLKREDVNHYLREPGMFAARASNKRGICELILCVRSRDYVHHITINQNRSITINQNQPQLTWTLIPRNLGLNFSNIGELVEYYKKNDLPLQNGMNLRLTKGAKRPSWILKRHDVEVDKKALLGEGNFCAVYRGKFLLRNLDVAVKVCHAAMNEKRTQEELDKEDTAQDTLIREGYVMHSIRHANVISFYGICSETVPVMIVMELCTGGSLLSHLTKQAERIGVPERIKYGREAAAGMKSLHSKNIVHRDLAARNCLISRYGTVKIADFGLSFMVTELTGVSFRGEQVPCRWMAPESLQKEGQKFTTKSDVWGYGVLLFEVFSNGAKPFPDWPNKKIATYIRRGLMPDMPEITPPKIKDLVKSKCWQVNADDRATMKTVEAELRAAQREFSLPPIEQLTVNSIPGVKALTPEEMEVLFEERHEVGMEVLVSKMGAAKPPTYSDEVPVPTGAREREPTIEDPAVQKQSTKRASRRRVRPDTSRDGTQELQMTTNDEQRVTNDEDKGIRKTRKSSRPVASPCKPSAKTPTAQNPPK